MRIRALDWRLASRISGVLTTLCLLSCASLSNGKSSLPARLNADEALVVLNLYRMNNVVGTDVEATFRLVNISTGVVYPRIEMFPNGYNVGSLKVVAVPAGDYKVKFVEFRSIGQGSLIRLNLESKTAQFEVRPGKIAYIGNVGIDNGNRDLFSQKYDLIRMGKSKEAADLEYLNESKWRLDSEWISDAVVQESGVFPEMIVNTI